MARQTILAKRDGAAAPANAGSATLLAFAGADGAPGAWRLIDGGAVVGRGDALAELPEQRPWVRTVLVVPGADVALHWLDLGEGLTIAQAAAAGRLRLADETVAPIGEMHVAAGRVETGLTAIASVPAARMAGWIAAAKAAAMEPDLIIPSPLLLMSPGEGLVRYAPPAGVPDYRGVARAFSLEDELAAVLLGDEPVHDLDDGAREAGLAPMLADPAINLRQGAFARRRETVLDRRLINWLAALALILLVVSLILQITQVARTTFAADRIQAEAAETRAALPKAGTPGAPRSSFAAAAGALVDVLRETPTASATQMVFQAGDGSLRASLVADSQATIDGLRARIEARGMTASAGPGTDLGGRVAADITLRPR